MKSRTFLYTPLVFAGCMGAGYAAFVAATWFRYGKVRGRSDFASDDFVIDQFMPVYDVAERHHVHVAAPAAFTLASACAADLQQSPLVRAIFRGRELLLGSQNHEKRKARGLIEELKSYGWGVLAEVPGREIAMGTVTQPWRADVEFHPLSPAEFTTFHEPGYVKIAFTLRADTVSQAESIFRTETRVMATDLSARTRFRRYWSFMLPGILLIRRVLLNQLKNAAERQKAKRRSISYRG